MPAAPRAVAVRLTIARAPPAWSSHAMIALSAADLPFPTLALLLSGRFRMTTTEVCSLRRARSLLAGLVVLVALLRLVGAAAPTAHADAVDANFVNALNSKGITFASRASRDRCRPRGLR